MNKNQKFTRDDVEAMRAQNEIKFANIMQMILENGKQMKENDQRLAKSKLETDIQLKQLGKDLREADHRSKERLDKFGKYLGGIANSNGEMAEEYFYSAFVANKTFANENFDEVRKNMAYNNGYKKAEFDIVLFNGKSAVLVEVKYNAKPENISVAKIISRVEIFKTLFPECKNFNIYLGVAAMSFKEGLDAELRNAGIATIHQIGEKMVIYDKEVKVF